MEKIFCNDCKYYNCDYGSIGWREECHFPKNKKVEHHSNHNKKWKHVIHIEIPGNINKNNDCEWFELKLWKKWWRAIKNDKL